MADTEPESAAALARRALDAAARHHGDDPAPRPPRPDDPDVIDQRARLRSEAWARIVPAVYESPGPQDLGAAGLPAAVVADLRAWSDDPTRNLVLLGPVGSGKTHLAWAALRRPFDLGRNVRAVAMVDLLDGLRPSASHPIDIDLIRTVDLLLLDDIGAERPSDWTDERTYALIHHRWEHRRPMVVTSNLDPAGLRAALGDRSYSRLIHNAVVLVIDVGHDRRNPKARR